MKENKLNCLIIILLAFTLSNSACAQNSGPAFLKEEKAVEKSTVLLNNETYLVPLRNIGNLKIASIHFLNTNANAFDSLLNKYTLVTPIDLTNRCGRCG